MVDESWFCNLLGSGRVTGNPSLIRLWKAGRQSAQNPSTRRVARGWRLNRVPDYKQNPECLVARRGFTKKARPLDRKISAETRRLSCQGVGLGCLADATLAFGRLCRVPAFLHFGCWLRLQKNPETESVRN